MQVVLDMAAQSKFQSTLPTRGSDGNKFTILSNSPKFQSTLPTRGSDNSGTSSKAVSHYFNPRSPRGGATIEFILFISLKSRFQSTLPTRGSDHIPHLLHQRFFISIHAPHEGERRQQQLLRYKPWNFNPRSPRGGATRLTHHLLLLHQISIHAPHEGERLDSSRDCEPVIIFQSTLPTRGSDGNIQIIKLA